MLRGGFQHVENSVKPVLDVCDTRVVLKTALLYVRNYDVRPSSLGDRYTVSEKPAVLIFRVEFQAAL
jgi:hypothetical protein